MGSSGRPRLRDLTRGGLAIAATEIAEAADLSIAFDETAIHVPGDVTAACDVLGVDPLHMANEVPFVT